jgi:hypothetical protein
METFHFDKDNVPEEVYLVSVSLPSHRHCSFSRDDCHRLPQPHAQSQLQPSSSESLVSSSLLVVRHRFLGSCRSSYLRNGSAFSPSLPTATRFSFLPVRIFLIAPQLKSDASGAPDAALADTAASPNAALTSPAPNAASVPPPPPMSLLLLSDWSRSPRDLILKFFDAKFPHATKVLSSYPLD